LGFVKTFSAKRKCAIVKLKNPFAFFLEFICRGWKIFARIDNSKTNPLIFALPIPSWGKKGALRK
jgi:hypothetical protein